MLVFMVDVWVDCLELRGVRKLDRGGFPGFNVLAVAKKKVQVR